MAGSVSITCNRSGNRVCRLLGYVSMSPVNLQTAVGPGLPEFVNLSSKHADGWGFAYTDRESGQLHARRMPESAGVSSTFKHLASATVCDAAILHLRWATPGIPIRMENTHPFVRGKYAFIHNGAISSAIERLAVPDGQRFLEGDTDSEKY